MTEIKNQISNKQISPNRPYSPILKFQISDLCTLHSDFRIQFMLASRIAEYENEVTSTIFSKITKIFIIDNKYLSKKR